MYNRWLIHYQRVGAHWGERNGPPYPLSRQKRFSEDGKTLTNEKYMRVTTERFTSKNSGGKTSDDGKLWMFSKINADYSERPTTKAVKLRTDEDYKNIKNVQIYDHFILNNKRFDKSNLLANSKILGQKVLRVLDKTNNGLPLKKREATIEEDLKRVNPSIITKTAAGSNNCFLCSIAYDMRRRGYDVMARQKAPIEYLYDINADEDIKYLYKNPKQIKRKTLSGITQEVSKQNNGNSRGILSATWNGHNSGHAVAYEVKNGKLTLYDAQDGSEYSHPALLFSEAHDFVATRTDNIEPDYRLIRLAVE